MNKELINNICIIIGLISFAIIIILGTYLIASNILPFSSEFVFAMVLTLYVVIFMLIPIIKEEFK